MELRKAVDNLCIYDPFFEKSAEKFLSETGGSSAAQPVGSREELMQALRAYSNVKFLEIILHGAPGMIKFADEGAMSGQYLGTMAQGLPLLKPNARILFDCCSIGKGCSGDKFMDELGERLLTGRGGIIGASTIDNIVFLPRTFLCSDIYLSSAAGGQLKVRKYDTNGKRVGERVVDRYGNVQ